VRGAGTATRGIGMGGGAHNPTENRDSSLKLGFVSLSTDGSTDRPAEASPGGGAPPQRSAGADGAGLAPPERRPAPPLRFILRTLGISPRLRLAAYAISVGAGRLWAHLTDPLVPPARVEERRARRERREGRRLARTLGVLKGPYAKLGQFASLRYDVVSPGLRESLADLRDRVPPLPFRVIRDVVQAELGRPLPSAFADFSEAPLGAASVAQAHLARLPDGTPVVVKVQYPWLAASLQTDLALLRRVLERLLGPAARRTEVDRLFGEFARGMEEELDFEREARIAAEIRENLASEPRVVVPRMVGSHSTRRVLCMEHHEAVPVTDLPGLARIGADPAEVLRILASAYARQVFVDGLFHADPHPGNLFVLPGDEAGPRVLFVDFGLSRRLGPELRRELRQAIFSILQRDPDAFVAGMDRMGMISPGHHESVRSSVARMFQRLAGEEGGPLQLGTDRILSLKDQAKVLLSETPGLQLPNDLLLYAKTLSYLFALGDELAPEEDLMGLTVPWLLRFLADRSG
jgi:predicted unusual protein kinase regulating ubiquinone biosynthesis (AarF/ABC1/UbiB family)